MHTSTGTQAITDAEIPRWVAINSARNVDTGCLEWTGSRERRYGGRGGDRPIVSKGPNRGRPVTRAMWEEIRGELSHEVVVARRCENSLCVRPSHLVLMTPKERSKATVRRGRMRSGGPALEPIHGATPSAEAA